MLTWERIKHSIRGKLFRAKVPGGWLIWPSAVSPSILTPIINGTGPRCLNQGSLYPALQLATEAAGWQRLTEAIGLILRMSEGGTG